MGQPDSARQARDLDVDRQVVAVLRLRVSPHGELVYGETIDAATERRRRFSSWSGLISDVRSLIAEALHDDPGANADARPGVYDA